MRRRSQPARWASLAGAAAVGIWVWAPHSARACSVCMGGSEDPTQGGFFVSAMVLSALPLALGGGFALWLRHRARQLARREQDGAAAGIHR